MPIRASALGEFVNIESSSVLLPRTHLRLATHNLSVASAKPNDWDARKWPVEVLCLFSKKEGLSEVI